uniref:Uncharacterized protein n=1 Tax=Knipowitschia caucasica TaxID=637954 RepID=A0AAV2MSQ7_KNICA
MPVSELGRGEWLSRRREVGGGTLVEQPVLIETHRCARPGSGPVSRLQMEAGVCLMKEQNRSHGTSQSRLSFEHNLWRPCWFKRALRNKSRRSQVAVFVPTLQRPAPH